MVLKRKYKSKLKEEISKYTGQKTYCLFLLFPAQEHEKIYFPGHKLCIKKNGNGYAAETVLRCLNPYVNIHFLCTH